MKDGPHHESLDYDHPAALRRAPPVTVSLGLTVAPFAVAYAVGHPYLAAAAVTVLVVLAGVRGRLDG
ncbi:hypothetical protein [Halomontanus rarus]|uniref:hypothetical protein n=1 Tax=Halomontanus rarus TaxID=3034020 RepID=UPI0023E818BA|nr:hypothetical protein [Halovivax sp. TS33]